MSCPSPSLRHNSPGRPCPGQSGALATFVLAVLLVAPGYSGKAQAHSHAETKGAEPSAASDVPEGTDVWLLELDREGDVPRATDPRNLTHRPGYDNQPFFTPTGDLLFVQMEDGKTDMWRWSTDSGRATRVTSTRDQGEFSPTPIPGSMGGISYIRSPDDTSGRLWRMPQEGAAAEIVFPDIGPVGYHATRTLATGVGRSPQSVPNRRAVSFTRATDRGTVIERYDLDRDRTEALAVLPEGGEFHAWTPDGVLLGSAGSRVVAWREPVR